MDWLLSYVRERFRPRVGWGRALLGAAAALCLPAAAGSTRLDLPVAPFVWAVLLGFLVGLRLAPAGQARGRGAWLALVGLLVLALAPAALFVLAAGQALPPPGLVTQDVGAWFSWAAEALRGLFSAGSPAVPAPRNATGAFLQESTARLWRELASAPDAGERGARLLVASGGVALAWIGALVFGYTLLRRRAPLVGGLPLLLPLLLVTMFGGGSGFWLIAGVGLLLVLAADETYRQRTDAWDRQGIDFSHELRHDVLTWGSLVVVLVLLLAWLLPAWLDNPVAAGVWGDADTPSGLAVLEREAGSGPRPRPARPIGLSELPGLAMGESLEQAPPEQIVLRIQVEQPLPENAWPHYWRARVFNIYTGRGWTTDARVAAQPPTELPDELIAGTLLQTIEDDRPNRRILIGLPNIIGVDVATNVEQLPSGVVTALTVDEAAARYRVLSSPQEQATPPNPSEPPDLSAFLALPAVPARVAETARAVTSDASTDYARALALERYLRGLRYSYEVAPLPAAGDAVDQFLFEMRQGYCTYYASSMAVMARSLGIPARVATGYATGEYERATQTYAVSESLAHAWPELYIDGRWLPFEPTPIRALPARGSGDQPPAPQVVAPAPAQAPSRGPLVWLAVLALFGLLGAAGWWLGRRPAPLPLVAQAQRWLEELGRRRGVAWPSGATLHEYGALLAARLGPAAPLLTALVGLVERARYGGRGLTADEEARLADAWRRLREAAEQRR